MAYVSQPRGPRRLASLGRASCTHSSWRAGGSSTLWPGPWGVSDWLFLAPPIMNVGVAIPRVWPWSFARFVPRVSRNTSRDCVGARLMAESKGLGSMVGSNSVEWKSGFLVDKHGPQGPESRYHFTARFQRSTHAWAQNVRVSSYQRFAWVLSSCTTAVRA